MFQKITPWVRKRFSYLSFTLGEEPPPTLGGELWRASSRLYRNRFCNQNTHFSAFFELHKIYIPLHRFKLKILILIVHFFTGIFEHFPEIQQFQIIQKNKGESIQIKYIKGVNFSKDILEDIKNKIFKRAEESFPITFDEVSKIKSSPSGKPQIIVREY